MQVGESNSNNQNINNTMDNKAGILQLLFKITEEIFGQTNKWEEVV